METKETSFGNLNRTKLSPESILFKPRSILMRLERDENQRDCLGVPHIP